MAELMKEESEKIRREKEQFIYACIDEEKYEEQMTDIVEPYLQKYAVCGKTAGLHFEFYGQEEPKGTIVISYGFTESCEKYHELIYYMHRAGYQAAVVDHRGHGKSLREVDDSQLVHVENFLQYADDLHSFITEEVMPRAKKTPLYLYAHSMGGCIGTLYLEKYPQTFEKAVLSAPMFGINNGIIPDFAAGLLCRAAILFGKKKAQLFTTGRFDPQEPFANSCCDSPARHNYYLKKRRDHKEYQTSGASYNWAFQAMKAGKRAVASENAAAVKIPVLLFQAANDTAVRAKEQDLFLSRIPNGRKVVKESKHEIYRMPGEKLEVYLAEIFAFYQG